MENIKVMLRLDARINSETNFRRRMIPANQDLDTVIQDLCMQGSIWELGARNNPLYLERRDLRPIPRGWHEFIIHNILPTTNQSEVTVKRAVLIHYNIHSQEVRVEKLIMDAMTEIIKNLHSTKPPLAFPNVIARLCEVDGYDTKLLPQQNFGEEEDQEQPAYDAAQMPQGYGGGNCKKIWPTSRKLRWNSTKASWPSKLPMDYAFKTWR
ncbi:hypothetical protein PIB30_051617 [Stylosanthes scabra]|uniref:Putative plant transposon protein domain-containing protein n=1 Tax=Stylosanthes scabra TaxID=79078 RepID=A0ABU6SIS9_9FABA|nr:hypothetical protein [Stylosanthes scabra]